MAQTNTCFGYSSLFCQYDWKSSSIQRKSYAFQGEITSVSCYANPYISKCGNTLLLCHGTASDMQKIHIIKREKEKLVTTIELNVGWIVEVLPTPNEKYLLVLINVEDDMELDNDEGGVLYKVILYRMSLCSLPIMFNELSRIPLPITNPGQYVDVFLVNDTYAVCFYSYHQGIEGTNSNGMLVYRIDDDLQLLHSVNLRKFSNGFHRRVSASCWLSEDVLVLVTEDFVLYNYDISKGALVLMLRVAHRRFANEMSLFHIVSPVGDYICAIEKPYYRGNFLDCSLWLIERNREVFSVQVKTLLDYIEGYNSEFPCYPYDHDFKVDTHTGNCFLLIGSQRSQFVGLFCFNLLQPHKKTKILMDSFLEENMCPQKPLMVVNELEEASEVLLFWCPNFKSNRSLVLDGYCIAKPKSSLKYFAKMCLKRLHSVDEISLMELPKSLRHYLLS